MNIREATMQDYEVLCSIFEEGDEYHRQALPHIFKKPDGSVRTKEFISSIISSENEILLDGLSDETISIMKKGQTLHFPGVGEFYAPIKKAKVDIPTLRREWRVTKKRAPKKRRKPMFRAAPELIRKIRIPSHI